MFFPAFLKKPKNRSQIFFLRLSWWGIGIFYPHIGQNDNDRQPLFLKSSMRPRFLALCRPIDLQNQPQNHQRPAQRPENRPAHRPAATGQHISGQTGHQRHKTSASAHQRTRPDRPPATKTSTSATGHHQTGQRRQLSDQRIRPATGQRTRCHHQPPDRPALYISTTSAPASTSATGQMRPPKN